MAYPPKYCRDTILQLARQGLTDLQVAIVVGCSKRLAQTYRKRANIRPTSRNQPWTKQEDAELVRLLIDGDRRVDIAGYLNRTLSEVLHRSKRLDVANRYNYYHFKLRVYDLIWLMHERGYSNKSISIRLKLSKSGASRIIRLKPKVI